MSSGYSVNWDRINTVEPTVKPLAERLDDEGELSIAITVDPSGHIMIDFGKPVHWFAMPREQAQKFALDILRQTANKVIKLDIPD